MSDRPANGFDSELHIVSDGPATWKLIAPLVWTGTKGDMFVVPIGFVTDFATVPRALVWKMLPYGPYTRAAVLHDYLLGVVADADARAAWQAGRGPAEGYLKVPLTSRDADGIFRRVMDDLGVPWLTRWQMWAAVRLASLFNSRRAYGRDFAADAPKVIGLLLISVPFVLPGLIGVLISLGLSWPFTQAARARAGA